MNNKPFTPNQFKPNKFSTAEDKAKFANHFVRFWQHGCPREQFYKWFYERWANLWGNIAHYNQNGFYETYFLDNTGKMHQIDIMTGWPYSWPDNGVWGDVEKVLVDWILQSGTATEVEKQRNLGIEVRERVILAALQAKYQDRPISPELLPQVEQQSMFQE